MIIQNKKLKQLSIFFIYSQSFLFLFYFYFIYYLTFVILAHQLTYKTQAYEEIYFYVRFNFVFNHVYD